MNWYPFSVAEYMVATAHLSNEEDLCYRRLLDTYYTGEKPLTLDVHSLARKIRCSVESCQQVLKEYFTETESGYQHSRCDREIEKYHARSVANKGNAEKRWVRNSPPSMPVASQSHPTGMPSHCEVMRKPCKTKSTESTIQEREEVRPRTNVVEKPDSVSEQVWADFLTHRRNRKAPLTATAFKTIQSEAQKAGKSLETALETMISRGWTGYKAEWDIVDSRGQNGRYGRNLLGATHIPNMPLGAPGCSCPECSAHREKLKKSATEYNPNL